MQVDVLARLKQVDVAGHQMIDAHQNGHHGGGTVQCAGKPGFGGCFHGYLLSRHGRHVFFTACLKNRGALHGRPCCAS